MQHFWALESLGEQKNIQIVYSELFNIFKMFFLKLHISLITKTQIIVKRSCKQILPKAPLLVINYNDNGKFSVNHIWLATSLFKGPNFPASPLMQLFVSASLY